MVTSGTGRKPRRQRQRMLSSIKPRKEAVNTVYPRAPYISAVFAGTFRNAVFHGNRLLPQYPKLRAYFLHVFVE